jgi:hypothetical protein
MLFGILRKLAQQRGSQGSPLEKEKGAWGEKVQGEFGPLVQTQYEEE